MALAYAGFYPMTIKQRIIGWTMAMAALVALVGIAASIGAFRSARIFDKIDRAELQEVENTQQLARAAFQLRLEIDACVAAAERHDAMDVSVHKSSVHKNFQQIDQAIASLQAAAERIGALASGRFRGRRCSM